MRRETDRAKEEWWKEECDKLEEMDKKGRSDLMYSKVKEITRTQKSGASSGSAIKDKNGMLLTEPDEVRNQWKEYIDDLHCGYDKPKFEELEIELEAEVDEDSKGP